MVTRRQWLAGAAAAASWKVAFLANAETVYPSRPVRLVVPSPPGAAPDALARLLGPALSSRLGQPFAVDNRPGGGGNIGTEAVVRARPDGYTLLLVATANAINTTLFPDLRFDFLRDIALIGGLSRQPVALLVARDFPATTIEAFLAHVRTHAGKVLVATAGIGSSPHMAAELFRMTGALDFVNVPFRGGAEALTALVGKQVHAAFGSTASAMPHIRSGALRALGVTTATRLPWLPQVPAIGESLKGYEASGVYGLGAPSGTAPSIIEKLSFALQASLADDAIRSRIAALDGMALPSSPATFARLMADETAKWGKVVRFAGMKPDA